MRKPHVGISWTRIAERSCTAEMLIQLTQTRGGVLMFFVVMSEGVFWVEQMIQKFFN